MSRPPKPAALKEAQGNPGKRATGAEAEAQLAGLGSTAPGHLDESGRAVWDRVRDQLPRNIVKATDENALAAYCQTVAQYWDATRQLRAVGAVYETESAHGAMRRKEPWFDIQQRLLRSMQTYESEFGLTPAARQRLLSVLAAQPQLPTAPMPADQAQGDKDAARGPVGLLLH